jgi:hypothetical protein
MIDFVRTFLFLIKGDVMSDFVVGQKVNFNYWDLFWDVGFTKLFSFTCVHYNRYYTR